MATVIRWTPVSERRNQLFNELWKPFPFEFESQAPQAAQPPMDVIDYDDRLEVAIDLPGIAPDSVNIEIEKGVLTISAPASPSEAQYVRQERYHGDYRRTFRVPDTLDITAASAAFEHGVLYLTLPKKPETQPVRIKVNA